MTMMTMKVEKMRSFFSPLRIKFQEVVLRLILDSVLKYCCVLCSILSEISMYQLFTKQIPILKMITRLFFDVFHREAVHVRI